MSKKKKPIKTRDHLMVKVINGATKAGVHKDRKKEEQKYAARDKYDREPATCLQCGFWLKDVDDLFCSETCEEYYYEQNCDE